MATVSIRTIDYDKVRERIARNDPILFERLQDSPVIRKSFSTLLRFDESSAIRAYAEYWNKLYESSPTHVLSPLYLVSEPEEKRERIIGVVTEKVGEKSLAQFVAAREQIAPKGKSEAQYSLKYSADNLRNSILRLNEKLGLYHGNVTPDEISVSFGPSGVTLKLGKPMFTTLEVDRREYIKSDTIRADALVEMLRIENLEQRGEFLSDNF